MPTQIITIENKYGRMTVHYKKLSRSRRVWSAPGLDVFVCGPLTGVFYEQAANLALQECIARHIPCVSLRKVIHRG